MQPQHPEAEVGGGEAPQVLPGHLGLHGKTRSSNKKRSKEGKRNEEYLREP